MKQTGSQLVTACVVVLSFWKNICSSGNEALSFSCVHELHLRSNTLVGFLWEIEPLLCRCDCDRDEASKLYFQAQENFRTECEKLFDIKKGICFPKTQEKMIGYSGSACYQTGYARCLFKISAGRTYRELSLRDDAHTYLRFTIDSSTSVDLPADAERFIWNDIVYQIYDGDCKKNLFPTGTYYVDEDGNFNLGKEISNEKLADEDNFLRKNWFVISEDNVKLYQDHVKLTDRVCEYDLGADSFVFIAENATLNEVFGEKQPVKKVVIKENAVEIYDKRLNTAPVDVTSKAYFVFDGVFKVGSDGNQYFVVNYCSHGGKVLRGSVGVHHFEIPVGKDYVMVNNTYDQAQQIFLYPENNEILKTYALISISNETITVPTISTISSTLFTNFTPITSLNSTDAIDSTKLSQSANAPVDGVIIAICVSVPAIVIIIAGVLYRCYYMKYKSANIMSSPVRSRIQDITEAVENESLLNVTTTVGSAGTQPDTRDVSVIPPVTRVDETVNITNTTNNTNTIAMRSNNRIDNINQYTVNSAPSDTAEHDKPLP